MTKRQRAKMVVAQLKAGEWEFRWNPISQEALTAERNGLELWCGNGAFFTKIKDHDCFGLLWRHYVWWAALRKAKVNFDKAYTQPRALDVDALLCSSGVNNDPISKAG